MAKRNLDDSKQAMRYVSWASFCAEIEPNLLLTFMILH